MIKPDFYADGYYRVLDNSERGSSILYEEDGEQSLHPSVFSLNWLKAASDYKLISNVTIGELFCGAGIGAVASKQLGLETVYAYDNNKHAVDTYNQNIHNIAQVKDLKNTSIAAIPYSDILMAGFPCQPFSVGGKGLGVNDPERGNLGKITYQTILHALPKAFLLENVKGLASKKNLPFLEELINSLSQDYHVSWDIINCADYGVPQNRERVFIVGIRKDIGHKFKFPSFTHKDNPVSIDQAIGDIKVKGDYISNHSEDCGIRNDEKPYIDYIPIGGNWKDLPTEDMKKGFMKGGYYSGGGRSSYLAVMDPSKPARTILSSPKGKNSAQILKWEGQPPRRYTVRESLRLQSVPDWFVFPDTVPLTKQYERCSGIPPKVSYLFLEQIKNIIKNTL